MTRTAKTFERGEALNERELEVLRWLDDTEFQTPRHVGGRDGSHHSNTLSALAGRGLVERKKYHAIQCPNGTTQRSTWHAETSTWVETTAEPYAGCRCKGHCRYRRTPAGKDAVRAALAVPSRRLRKRSVK